MKLAPVWKDYEFFSGVGAVLIRTDEPGQFSNNCPAKEGMMFQLRWPLWFHLTLLAMLFTLAGCAGNRYEQKAEVIKRYVQSFYGHLEEKDIDKAVFDNQNIEAVALESEEYLLRRVGQMSHAERTQEWKVIKRAKETAAENWLALARYFSQVQQYERARGTYQRLIESYGEPAYQTYVERATAGLRDVELILSSGKTNQ